MEAKHLIYLSTILEKGSISAAAEYLAVAQPTLTRAMATLEMQAGTQLFSRSRYGVSGTPIGEALAREGKAIIRTMEIAKEQLSRYQLGLKKELRIAAGPLIGLAVIPDIIERVTAEAPNNAVTIRSARPAVALDELLDDQHDVVIAPAPHDRPISGVLRRQIAEDVIGVYCSEKHPLAKKKKLNISDFESADWLTLGLASPFERQVLELLLSGGIKHLRTKVAFKNDAAMLIKMLARGRHLAVLPRLPLTAIGPDYGLVELKVDLGAVVHRNLYLWTREEVVDHPAYITFLAVVTEIFADLERASFQSR
ncbi:LysR family transcriptional regulator [Marinobacterium lutimaris]|uniref:DNA-binding transcriptional regulator, LysR family n=1 Tax=Marinobacterium lutimaris TaxID=568106 RepID=A0A1H6C2D9_9GAMM|nr:LysR family transcriptional regulator [Marinobacterium lutimaris]SEG66857.1 DNA-binding transcriptional regulator, LysR family [Marinobacterium lutimaris]